MEFCKCGSLKIEGICSNRNCDLTRKDNLTHKQYEYLLHLHIEAKQELPVGLINMTKKEASRLIDELEKLIDCGVEE